MTLHGTKWPIVFSSGTGLTELEPGGEALEADECGEILLAVLTDGLHGCGDLVYDGGRAGTSPLGLHVVHNGNVGHVGVC